jgi:hypothetical protein
MDHPFLLIAEREAVATVCAILAVGEVLLHLDRILNSGKLAKGA